MRAAGGAAPETIDFTIGLVDVSSAGTKDSVAEGKLAVLRI